MSDREAAKDPRGAVARQLRGFLELPFMTFDGRLLVMGEHDVAWHVESSGNGQEWRALGRAWTAPGEPLLVHGAGPYLRIRPVGGQDGWTGPLERTSHACMALIDLQAGTREDLWPADEHLGLPVFLPGGEAGRLLRFERSEDGFTWTYALEFMGEVPTKFRTDA